MNEMVSRRSMCVFVVAMCMFWTLLGSGPAYAVLSLYDDFNDPSHLIRADLWNHAGDSSTGGAGSGRTDSVTAIDLLLASESPFLASNPADPKLLIGSRFVLQPGAGSGSFERGGYTMRQAVNAIGIQADVTMRLCILSTAGFIQAGVQLFGFNDGTPGGAGNETGDIFTRLRISCTNTNQAQITWNVWRCNDAACNSTTSLGTGSFGAANIGQEYTLHVAKSGSSFVFTAVGQTQTFPVPGSPTAPARVPFNGPRTRIDPDTPANGGEFAYVATFDDVMVDQ